MNQAKKQDAIDKIVLLKKANNAVKKLIGQHNVSAIIPILEDCQNVAIILGTTIEQTVREGSPIVKLLEEYCENIYLLHEKIMSVDEEGANKQIEILNEYILKIHKKVIEDVPVRKEVVFLPYKASMWDSLESVWRKMDRDPDVDAYVIPIPYYDKNTDGSVKEWHYEGTLFPIDVPVIDYRNYEFENHFPDEVYIHNPYDDANYVTSVAPFFYSKNIKNYTDCLIYIPYFVLPEPDINNEEVLKQMSHFVIVPANIYANKIIVQSENMRQAYIKILTGYMGDETKEIWEEKIKGSGSPKFEKIINASREKQEIPQEWLQKIKKEDGSWKKIVLYNNGLEALLHNDTKMIKKMKRVFEKFYRAKEDITLLWRPHPLILSTIESMRPHLYEKYCELMEQYKEANWGIYDDSPDVDRAVILCDAYYGDSSSVVELCLKVNKPVMIQDCNL